MLSELPASLAIYAWLTGVLLVICLTFVACWLGYATIKAENRGDLAACFRAIAEIIRALR